jgi:hypothetical protein
MDARISHRAGNSGGAVRAFARWVRTVMGGRQPDPTVVRAPEGVEDTGIWGVGGPAMREPGSTGIVRALHTPREDAAD